MSDHTDTIRKLLKDTLRVDTTNLGDADPLFSAGLIVEHKAGFMDAVGLSLKGIVKNFWGLALLVQFSNLLYLFAAMMCIVPAFLTLPIITAGHFLAYKKIFRIDAVEKPTPDQPVVVVGQYR